jgi:putative transcriptional regulator
MTSKSKKRELFSEMMKGVRAMRAHRGGRITLRSHRIEPIALPAIDEVMIRTTRERLHMSRSAFARRLGVNPRTLERWEQGRSKPNDQAAALILLVRKYPDTLARLAAVAAG